MQADTERRVVAPMSAWARYGERPSVMILTLSSPIVTKGDDGTRASDVATSRILE